VRREVASVDRNPSRTLHASHLGVRRRMAFAVVRWSMHWGNLLRFHHTARTTSALIPYYAIVGRVVRLQREARGLKLREFSKRMALGISGRSRVETGDTVMTLEQLKKAADALGVTPAVIVKMADDMSAGAEKRQSKRGSLARGENGGKGDVKEPGNRRQNQRRRPTAR
jgi:transcriptional regulator with XRE-family HTH domain